MKLIFNLIALTSLVVAANTRNLSAQTPTISGVVNTCLQVREVSDRGSRIYVANGEGSNVSAGDWLLLIQHQGAGQVAPGDCDGPTGGVTAYDAAGNFELVRVKTVNLTPAAPYALLDCIELEAPMRMFYYAGSHTEHRVDFPRGNYYGLQAVVVPYFEGDVEITGDVTADPWDGTKGGVVALVAEGTVTMKANIDVSGKGFRGGGPSANNSSIDQADYVSDPADNNAGSKGEGIIDIALGSPDLNAGRIVYEENAGRGALANGGGGGNGKNAGGGGGSNYGPGGRGGNQNSSEDAPAPTDDEEQLIGGEGGWDLAYMDKLPSVERKRTQIFFGGGGGGGHRSNDNGSTSGDSKGGAGGGIVLILAEKIIVDNGSPTGRFISANGTDGASADNGANGAGGGGAGGTILLDVDEILSPGTPSRPLVVQVEGGMGGTTTATGFRTGPGGGGGGGVVWFRTSTHPTNVWYNTGNGSILGGTAGQSNGTSSHGAANGEDGALLYNLTYPKWYAAGEDPI